MTTNLQKIKEFMNELEVVHKERPNRLCANFVYLRKPVKIGDLITTTPSQSLGLALDVLVKFKEKDNVFRVYLKCEVDEEGESDQQILEHVCKIYSDKQYLYDEHQMWIVFYDLYRNQRLGIRVDNILGCAQTQIVVSEQAIIFPYNAN